MRRQNDPTSTLENPQVPVQAKLAASWASFMLLYVYVDILGLYMPGVINDILAGIVWELEVTQAWAFGALALMAVPILMVALSVTLPARANRVINLVVASVYVLALILRCAWTWPRTAPAATVDDAVVRMQQV